MDSGYFYLLNHTHLARVQGETGARGEQLQLDFGWSAAEISPDGKYIVLASKQRQEVKIVRTHPLTLSKTISVEPELCFDSQYESTFFASDSRSFLMRTPTGTSKVNVETGESTALSKELSVWGTANRQPFAFGTIENRLSAIDVDTGKLKWSGPELPGKPAGMDICFDDSIIVVAYLDVGEITMHRASDGTLLRTLYTMEDASALRNNWGQRFIMAKNSPYFAYVNSAGNVRTLQVWHCDPSAKRPLRVLFCRRKNDLFFDWDDESGILIGAMKGFSGYPMPKVDSQSIPSACNSSEAAFLDESRIAANFSDGGGVSVVDLDDPTVMLWSRPGYSEITRSRNRDCCLAAYQLKWLKFDQTFLLVTPDGATEYLDAPQSLNINLAVSPGGKYVATAGTYHHLTVMRRSESSTWEQVLHYQFDQLPRQAESSTELLFPAAEQPRLLTSNISTSEEDPHREHRMYDLKTGELLFTKKDPIIYRVMALDPTGKVLWTGGPDGLIRGYDSLTLELLFEQRCHDQDISAIAFRPDMQMLASGDANGIIRLWNIRDGRLEESVDEMIATSEAVESLDFNDSGTKLLSLSGRQVRIWDTSQLIEAAIQLAGARHQVDFSNVKSLTYGQLLGSTSVTGKFYKSGKDTWIEKNDDGEFTYREYSRYSGSVYLLANDGLFLGLSLKKQLIFDGTKPIYSIVSSSTESDGKVVKETITTSDSDDSEAAAQLADARQQVDGSNVKSLTYGLLGSSSVTGKFYKSGKDTWIEKNDDGEFTYKEYYRDSGSVYLLRNDGQFLGLSLKQQLIFDGTKPIYSIVSSSTESDFFIFSSVFSQTIAENNATQKNKESKPDPCLVLLGNYKRVPATNGWHKGKITIEKKSINGHILLLRWTNEAGKSWILKPMLSILAEKILNTGTDNPYYDDKTLKHVRIFRLEYAKDKNTITGFKFLQDTYRKVK